MLLSFLGSLLLFFGVTLGLAWPVAARLRLAAAERLVVSATLSLIGVFLCAWLIYLRVLPPVAFWLLPLMTALCLLAEKNKFAEMWRDADARSLALAQLLVTAWCVGWMATVQSYSGGGWAGDWFEHWERAKFFLEHWPLDRKFLVTYPLAARPPLANVVTGAFLWLTRADYAHYQLVTTLLASFAFLPSALLARRWGGAHAIAVLAVLFMVSPSFVENATFAWTKLPAAFFVLAGIYFFLRTHDAEPPPLAAPLCGALLAAGMLAHYSAGPYLAMLAGLWFALGWSRWRDAAWWRTTGTAALAGAALLAVWFGWAFLQFGVRETLLSNSSATSRDVHEGNQLVKIALNLRDTLVPHFLRSFDTALIAQRSTWGWARDWFFQCYQINLPLAFGSVAWLAIARELLRTAREVAPRARNFWAAFIVGVVLLGVAAHGARDQWGLAHICLQALVLLGLAFLAARWPTLSRGWRLALLAGAAVDFVCGIALQFGVESYAFDRWLAAGRDPNDTLRSYSEPAFMNLAGKIQNHLDFFSDVFAPPPALDMILLAALLALALVRANRTATHAR